MGNPISKEEQELETLRRNIEGMNNFINNEHIYWYKLKNDAAPKYNIPDPRRVNITDKFEPKAFKTFEELLESLF